MDLEAHGGRDVARRNPGRAPLGAPTRPYAALCGERRQDDRFCLPDGDKARHLYSKARVEEFTEVFFHWLDSIPRPAGFPKDGPVKMPPVTIGELKAGLAAGGRQVGGPEEITEVVKMYDEIGVDQLIYAPLTFVMDQKYVLESIETFGRHVLPKFDRDPIHSTTRQREAALAAKAA